MAVAFDSSLHYKIDTPVNAEVIGLLTPLVQVSPISIIVAVALDLSDPPQQSPIFGHLALSQT